MAQRTTNRNHYHVTCTDPEYHDGDEQHCYTKADIAKVYANVVARNVIKAGHHVTPADMQHLTFQLGNPPSSVPAYFYREYTGKIIIALASPALGDCPGHIHKTGSSCKVYGCVGYRW